MSSFSELREQKMQRAWFSCVGRWATLLLSSVLASLQEMVRACMMWIIFAGPTPSHIAFIMDGNRRFADRLHVDRRIGHSHGYDALLHTLKDCFDLHVKTVTLFAFSIDNFQRHPDEVSALMDLMQSKLETLTEKQGLASEYGIRVQILGDLRLLPEPARLAAEKAMAVTRQNSTVLLNLCICYTSTHEIVQAIQRTRNDFLAAWGVSCKQYGDSSHSTHPNEEGNHDSENGNKVLENGFHSMQGGDEQFTNCEHNYASNNCNGGNLDPTFHQSNRVHVNGNGCSRTSDEENFNEYEMSSEDEIVAESRMLSRDMRCSSLLNSDAYSIGLRNRNEKKAQVSDDSSFMDLPLHASCSSDMHLRTAACADKVKNNGKCCEAAPVRNGCTQREDVVGEIEHGDFYNAHEVVGFSTGALRSSYQCLSNPESSGNSWCPLHRFYSQDSCEDEKKVQSLLTRNFDEPHDACNRILKAVKDCISEEEIEKNLYTYPCPHPDLLIRTSGETRLSNFLLWQTSFSHLAFCKVLWPEFSFRHLFFIILEYQRAYPSLLRKRQYYSLESWTHH